jgi:hypothetical protein
VIVEPEPAQSLGSIIIDPQLMAIDPRVVAEHINGGVVASPRSRSATQIEIDATNKEALATTVKRIVRSAKEGHTEEAYAAYAELFGDSRFAQQRLQDQRQVLKLMVLAKTEPHPSEQVTSAYESALARLRALAAEADDPLDREMIAVCEKRLNRNGASAEPTTSS